MIGGKRALNEYFKKMLDAKKKGLKEFKYKDKVYKRCEVKAKTSSAILVYYTGSECKKKSKKDKKKKKSKKDKKKKKKSNKSNK